MKEKEHPCEYVALPGLDGDPFYDGNKEEREPPARGRWSQTFFILDGSIVGVISETASAGWEAAGCMADWMDVPLGIYRDRDDAKDAVEEWVEANV